MLDRAGSPLCRQVLHYPLSLFEPGDLVRQRQLCQAAKLRFRVTVPAAFPHLFCVAALFHTGSVFFRKTSCRENSWMASHLQHGRADALWLGISSVDLFQLSKSLIAALIQRYGDDQCSTYGVNRRKPSPVCDENE